jgi:hypothetical protein
MIGLVLAVPLVSWWCVTEAVDVMFGNDPQTFLQTSQPLLNGRVRLGLYRQHMWDAWYWTVVASTDSLAPAIVAPNGVLPTTLPIVFSKVQLGFQEPPLQLRAMSETEAALCGKLTCRTIRCTAASQQCQLVSDQ